MKTIDYLMTKAGHDGPDGWVPGKVSMAMCVNGDSRIYLGGHDDESAHTIIDMETGEVVKCPDDLGQAAKDFWAGIGVLRAEVERLSGPGESDDAS